ncbi:MAG: aldehyde dehydrogenase family protein, partial [Burkholderiaceae bacterium]|nr:aldehyde dehydrogenase family protein [Burkholderiaceae bacterium]
MGTTDALTTSLSSTAEVGHFIAGQAVASRGGQRQPVYNPATGAVARQVALASAEEVNAAVAAAQAAFDGWADTPPIRRARVLFKFL